MNRVRVYGPVRTQAEPYGSYSTTLKTIARIYDIARSFERSQAAKRGWITRRATIARKASP